MRYIDDVINKLTLSQAEEVVYYIIRHTDGDTKIFSRSYNQIQKDLNVTAKTVAKVFKLLEANGTLIRAGLGRWYVPAVIGYEPNDEDVDWAIRI